MNWELVKWVAGILMTFAGIKFVFALFRSLFNKETINDALDGIGEKISDASNAVTNAIKKKAIQRKAAKKAEETEQSIVIVR